MLVSGFATDSLVLDKSILPFSNAQSTPIYVQHIILVPFENMNISIVNGSYSTLAPYDSYLRALMTNSVSGVPSGSVTNYYGVFYPSTPNYLVLTSGSEDGYPCDQPNSGSCQPYKNYAGCSNSTNGCDLNPTAWNTTGASIFSQASWSVFAENEQSNCQTRDGTGQGTYVQYIVHHTAAPYFDGSGITEPCLKAPQYDVPMGSFSHGTNSYGLYNAVMQNASYSLPQFSLVVGDICDDMHTCSGNGYPSPYPATKNELEAGDNFSKSLVNLVKGSSYWTNTLIIFVWDTGNAIPGQCCKDTTHGGGHIAFIVVSGAPNFIWTKEGSIGSFQTHYDTASTIENCLNLPLLNASATSFCSSLLAPEYYLTMNLPYGGSPSSGFYSTVQISATPYTACNSQNHYYLFSGWTGSGTGSYTGTNNPATITLGSNVTETGNYVLEYHCPNVK